MIEKEHDKSLCDYQRQLYFDGKYIKGLKFGQK